MKTILTLIMGAMVLAGAAAQARWWCDGGPYADTHLVSQTTTTAGACGRIEKLHMSRKTQQYPQMNDATLTVDYWRGAYGLPVRTHSVYQVDMYDCRGDLQHSYTRTEDVDSILRFDVDNPNLHEDVTTSFEANAPMTDAEAAAALDVAKQECLDWHP